MGSMKGRASLPALMTLVVCVWAFVGHGQQSAPPTRPAEVEPEYPRPTRVPVDLLTPQKPEAIILPSEPAETVDQIGQAPGGLIELQGPVMRVLPDGYAVANRPAVFTQGQPWSAVELDPVEGLPISPSLRILPNRQLALLERVSAEGTPGQKIRVTGRVTEFLGKNYLLVEQVTATAAPVAEPKAKRPEGPGPASQSARPPTAEEIIDQLMKEAPGSVLRPRAASGSPASAPAETVARRATQPEGTLVPETPGRLVGATDGWSFVRESRGDRPMPEVYNLLPNRLLEVMVSASRGGTRPLIFLISGELTEYRGQNHLLVRKVLIRRDMGNVR